MLPRSPVAELACARMCSRARARAPPPPPLLRRELSTPPPRPELALPHAELARSLQLHARAAALQLRLCAPVAASRARAPSGGPMLTNASEERGNKNTEYRSNLEKGLEGRQKFVPKSPTPSKPWPPIANNMSSLAWPKGLLSMSIIHIQVLHPQAQLIKPYCNSNQLASSSFISGTTQDLVKNIDTLPLLANFQECIKKDVGSSSSNGLGGIMGQNCNNDDPDIPSGLTTKVDVTLRLGSITPSTDDEATTQEIRANKKLKLDDEIKQL
ncbi:hypothetical protein EJB05_44968, partial [Eragrostis curvula]